ncbi:hypothetical protein FB451DRAFT_1549241 [Mycena latifolia]|nr:hypothetical protein FB451DRAFT_1549241 [Mycena latifolia]
MKLLSLFLVCGSVWSLSVPDSVIYSRAMGAETRIAQRQGGNGIEVPAMLWKRAPKLDRLTTTTIVVGVIGGVAMVGALFLGIVLVVRKQRERQKRRDALQSSPKPGQDIVHFQTKSTVAPIPDGFAPQSKERPYYAYQHLPAPASPPQPERRLPDNMESAWFVDKADAKLGGQSQRAKTPPVRRTPSRQTSRQDMNAIPEGISRGETTSSHARRSESDSRPSGTKSRTRIIPPPLLPPTHESERPPSPIVFRQPNGDRNQAPIVVPQTPLVVSPGARKSSLPSAPGPTIVIPPPPPAGRHVTSVSEDSRPVSRFSISPVSRSFPRLTLTGTSPPSSRSSQAGSRHTRRYGFGGSFSSLVHLRSDTTFPDVPTDVAAT